MWDADDVQDDSTADCAAESTGLAWAEAITAPVPVLRIPGRAQRQVPIGNGTDLDAAGWAQQHERPRSAFAPTRPGSEPSPTQPTAQVAPQSPRALRWRRLRAWSGPALVVTVSVALAVLAACGVFDGVALLNPMAALVVEVVAGLAVAGSWWSRQIRWWRWRLPVTVLIAGAVAGAAAALLWLTGTVTDPYPPTFAVWVTLAVASLVGCCWTVRRGGQARRTLALAAVPLTVCGGFLLINDEYGLWPTVGDLVGHGTTNANLDTLLHLPPGTHPSKGVVANIDVPATRSHFPHRPGSVYLPPAFFGKARATLPVVVMLAGAPGAPTHWISAGHAVETADAYATAHHGNAPIMIFVDQNGSATGDTECVDGPQGDAETFLTVDVPAFVSTTLKIKPAAKRWAVVGFSEGGTCALDLTLAHPTVFNHLADLAGDPAPNLGNPDHTLSTLFGGSTSAQAAHDPLTLLSNHHYKGISAWFAAGATDTKKLAVAQQLATAARPAGLTVHEFTGTGGHNWQFASDAFRRILPALYHDLGLKG